MTINDISSGIEIAIFSLTLLATYQLFVKMGMAGWKGLIPGYNGWCLFDKLWESKYWFISMGTILTGCVSICFAISGAYFITAPIAAFLTVVGIVCIFTTLVISIVFAGRVSRAFGHGKLFAAGYIFFEPIFTMILGFGNSEYLGA